MTPNELNMKLEEFWKAKEEDIKEARFLAYMTAKLPLYKKFPETFEKAFGMKEKTVEIRDKEPQTENQMFNEMLKIHKALGGTVY
jgi:hypothetical protein